MKIVIINGNPEGGDGAFDRWCESLAAGLEKKGHHTPVFTLRDMDIRYCTGCWTCWWKTPGLCMHHDSMPEIYRAIMASDLMFLASPVIMGFVSALLKRANERLIPLLHPYIVLDRGECHHRGRYERYPAMGLILGKGPDADDEDISIITDIYRRDAINFKSRLRHVLLTDKPATEVIDEIDAL